MSVWCIMFFKTDKRMRVFESIMEFQTMDTDINTSFRQLCDPIRRVRKIEYHCPYIILTDASPYGTCLCYWIV